MSFILLALYAGSAVAYALHFARREASVGRTATTLLMVAVLVHTFVVAMQTMQAGQFPISTTSLAVPAFVWLLASIPLSFVMGPLQERMALSGSRSGL